MEFGRRLLAIPKEERSSPNSALRHSPSQPESLVEPRAVAAAAAEPVVVAAVVAFVVAATAVVVGDLLATLQDSAPAAGRKAKRDNYGPRPAQSEMGTPAV